MEEHLKHAGFFKRLAAYCIDSFLLNVVVGLFVMPLAFVLGFLGQMNGWTDEEAFLIGCIFLVSLFLFVSILYYGFCESSEKTKGTIGKYALGIKVVDLNGNTLSFWRAIARYFSMYATVFTCGVGYLMIGFTESKQAFHDIIAGCLVVENEQKRKGK